MQRGRSPDATRRLPRTRLGGASWGMDLDCDSFEPVDIARVRLRCVRPADAEGLAAMMTPGVSRWVASWPVPCTPDMAAERIAAARRAAGARDALPFAVERRSDGALLGWMGVSRDAADQRRGVLGYWLGEAFHGHGYIREAAPAAIAAAFEGLGLDVVGAGAQPGNAASFAVLRGCGMVPVGERMVFVPSRGREELCLFHEVGRPAG